MKNWQEMVGKWVVHTFGIKSMSSRERSLRFLEEAVELVQAHGISHEDVSKQVARVYIKPVGQPTQEVGGVMITLLAFCDYHRYNAYECMKTEWTRINSPGVQDKLKASQESKLEAGL